MPSEVRVNGQASEVQALASPNREHATDQASADHCHDDRMILEGRADGFGGLAERTRFRLELAAVFLEGRVDELGDRGALPGRRQPDRNLGGSWAQMPVCSGR